MRGSERVSETECQMTPSERVAAAFEGRPCDKIPIHHVNVSSEVASAVLGREAFVGGGIQRWREAVAIWNGEDAHAEFMERSRRDALDVARAFDNDLIRPRYWGYSAKPTRRISEHVFLYEYGEEQDWQVLTFDPPTEQCHIVPHLPGRAPSLDDIEADIAKEEARVGEYRPTANSFPTEVWAQQLLGDEYAIRTAGVAICIPLEDIWLEALALRPSLVERLLDIQVERACRNVEVLASLGFRYMFGGGDLASHKGPVYSPRHFRDLVVPRLRKVTDFCEEHGVYHLFASDGDIWPLADDLFEHAGIHGYYEIDRRAGMDLRRLHDRYPDLTTIGNISSHTLHVGSKDAVVGETLDAIEEGKRHSHTVVGVSNLMMPGTPIDNVLAMMETLREER